MSTLDSSENPFFALKLAQSGGEGTDSYYRQTNGHLPCGTVGGFNNIKLMIYSEGMVDLPSGPGALQHQLHLSCVSLGLNYRTVGGFDENLFENYLGTKPSQQVVCLAALGG